MTYAVDTNVPADRTRGEIEKTLARYGADGFLYGAQGDRAVVAFTAHGRQIRFLLPMPDRQEFYYTPTGMERSAASVERKYDQAVRSRWRALLLVIKAKLEAIESGVVSFEDEFLAQTVLADNTTVGEWAQAQITRSYTSGTMPELLPQPRTAIEGRK